MVRLLHFRDGVGTGIRPAVLPHVLGVGRHARRVRLVRGRIRGAAGRRPGVRPLRRPHRTQDDAGRHIDNDGSGHIRNRLDAHLRGHRGVGADTGRRAPLPAGPRGRRRVGRRGADGHGTLGPRAARLLRQLRANGQCGRRVDVHRHVFAGTATPRGRVPVLGLAGAVPVQRRVGVRGPVHPVADHGVAGLCQDQGDPPSGAGAGGSSCCAPTPSTWRWPQECSWLMACCSTP